MHNILSPCLLCFFSQMPISASVIFFSPVLAIGFFAHGGNGLVEIWLGIFGRSPTRRGGGQMCGPDLGVFLRRWTSWCVENVGVTTLIKFVVIRRRCAFGICENGEMRRENWSKWFKWLGGFTEPLG